MSIEYSQHSLTKCRGTLWKQFFLKKNANTIWQEYEFRAVPLAILHWCTVFSLNSRWSLLLCLNYWRIQTFSLCPNNVPKNHRDKSKSEQEHRSRAMQMRKDGKLEDADQHLVTNNMVWSHQSTCLQDV